MRWRDIRFEKPTEADGDQYGEVLFFDNDGDICASSWSNDTDGHLFWMAMSEIPKPPDRIPDPPEGWRFVDKEKEAFDNRAKIWNRSHKKWILSVFNYYHDDYVYIVPIGPPAPTYRPFANAAEFDGWATLFWRYKEDSSDTRRSPMSYSDQGHFGDSWKVALDEKVFSDGSPFGVKVEP
jgi:hypothetical protein